MSSWKIQINPSTPLLPNFTIKVKKKGKETIAELLQNLSKQLGIGPEYIVLYKTTPALDSKTNALTFRSDDLRIDYQPSTQGECKLQGTLPIDVFNIPKRIEYQIKQLDIIEACRTKWQQQTLKDVGIEKDSVLQLALRPLRGDHTHYVVAFYVDQDDAGPKPLSVLIDRPNLENIFEGKHIYQIFPHFGLHGGGQLNWFSEGLSHIHPGTAWNWFHEAEGLGSNIDAFLEQIGVWIWEKNSVRYPSHGPLSALLERNDSIFDFPIAAQFQDGRKLNSILRREEPKIDKGVGDSPEIKGEPPNSWNAAEYALDRILIGNKDDEIWKMYYYPFYAMNDPKFVSTENFGRTWLNENLGAVIFSYERRSHNLQPQRKLILDRFLYLGNLIPNNVPKLYPPFIDDTDESPGKSLDAIPYNVSSVIIKGFDGTYYPMPNYLPEYRNLEFWKNSWIWKYIK